jgi:hypothetical protein
MDRLTKPQIEKFLQGMTKEKALCFLQEAGIIDENGQLTKPYRSLDNAKDKPSLD